MFLFLTGAILIKASWENFNKLITLQQTVAQKFSPECQ